MVKITEYIHFENHNNSVEYSVQLNNGFFGTIPFHFHFTFSSPTKYKNMPKLILSIFYEGNIQVNIPKRTIFGDFGDFRRKFEAM